MKADKMNNKEYWKIHEEGRQSCQKVDNDCSKANNPYKKGSEKWKTWNRGWNSF
jgi:hypothetical protein